MSDSYQESVIASLRDDVARRFGRRLETATDFMRLAEEIAISKAGYVSSSTLKRYWGYVKVDYSTKRQTTLDILARYVGYADFNHYSVSLERPESVDSGFNTALTLDVQTLQPGALLLISWHPGHSITGLFEGNLTFCIVESRGSRLAVGLQFKCLTVVKGQPLILTVKTDDANGNSFHYVAGKKHGIDWKLL